MKKEKYDKYGDKKTQRAKLKELAGSIVSCKGKFTRGLNTASGGKTRRMLLDVTIYLRGGEKLFLHHIWIPEKAQYYNRYEGKYLDFKAKVITWGLENKATLEEVYVKEFKKK